MFKLPIPEELLKGAKILIEKCRIWEKPKEKEAPRIRIEPPVQK